MSSVVEMFQPREMTESHKRGCIITAVARMCGANPDAKDAILDTLRTIAAWTDGVITLDMVERARKSGEWHARLNETRT